MKPLEKGVFGADSVGCRFVRRSISPPQENDWPQAESGGTLPTATGHALLGHLGNFRS
jgi:hypothetical protein